MVLLMLLATTTKALWAVSGSCYIFLQDYLDHYPRRNVLFFFFSHKYFSARSMSWITTERDPASARTSARQVLGTHVGKKKRNTTGIMCYITLPLPLNHLLKPKPHSKKIFWQEIITNTHGYDNVFYHPRERRGNGTQNFLSKQLELYNYS